MKTFYGWMLQDPDHPEHDEFMTGADGKELRFDNQEAALAYITDEVIGQLIKDGIDPNTVQLAAYEVDLH
jgi:arabinogalactan endo-1,4-beta-galactosidase